MNITDGLKYSLLLWSHVDTSQQDTVFLAVVNFSASWWGIVCWMCPAVLTKQWSSWVVVGIMNTRCLLIFPVVCNWLLSVTTILRYLDTPNEPLLIIAHFEVSQLIASQWITLFNRCPLHVFHPQASLPAILPYDYDFSNHRICYFCTTIGFVFHLPDCHHEATNSLTYLHQSMLVAV